MPKIESPKSAALFKRAQQVLPGGVSRNTLLHGDYPYYVDRGEGCRIIDVDGISRIDFANNMAAHIHGHAFAPIVTAVTEQLQYGTAFTMATEAEVKFAEHMCSRATSFNKIRFVNSGTEAVMAGMKAARAFTGRTKIAKVEGSYHGAYDYAEVSQSPTPGNWGAKDKPNAVPLAHGTPTAVLEDMIIIPFNDAEKAIAILEQHKEQIACVLIDPIPHRIGMIPIDAKFAQTIRKWTTNNSSLLMFDEVITFRSEFGGMQQRLDVIPDLTAMGKMIGGGFPVGALAGSDDVMGVFTKGDKGLLLPHSGTFSANPVTMTAGLIAMELFDREAIAKLNKLGDYARQTIADVIKTAGVPACVTGTGSLFRIHLSAEVPTDYRDSHHTPNESMILGKFIDSLYDEGVMMIHTAAATLSTPMNEAVIDEFADSLSRAFASVKDLLLENS